eukprot:492637_1
MGNSKSKKKYQKDGKSQNQWQMNNQTKENHQHTPSHSTDEHRHKLLTQIKNAVTPPNNPAVVMKYVPSKENINIDYIDQKHDESQWTIEYIEWSDLEVLRNVIGVWCMGIIETSFEFLKIEFTMDYNGDNRKWRATITSGIKEYKYMIPPYKQTVLGEGIWKLMYPTSINIRPNIYYLCNYYGKLYGIFMGLSRDVINVIGDYIIGKGIRSLDLIDLQLILQRNSFKVKTMENSTEKPNIFIGQDIGLDFIENCKFPVKNCLSDLLLFCINEVENKDENALEDYDNLMKLDTFTDEEDDAYFDDYFH